MTEDGRNFDGSHWDPRKIRRVREYGWFKEHEAEMIDAARRRAAASAADAAERNRRNVVARALALVGPEADRDAEPSLAAVRRKCPRCGAEMKPSLIGSLETDECSACQGVFLDRGALTHLLGYDARRRSFLRRMLGLRSP